jgi:hypothetical protein
MLGRGTPAANTCDMLMSQVDVGVEAGAVGVVRKPDTSRSLPQGIPDTTANLNPATAPAGLPGPPPGPATSLARPGRHMLVTP